MTGPPSLVLRLRYRVRGSHVHCRVFTAPAPDTTWAKAGLLLFRVEEWAQVRHVLELVIEVVPEEEED